jgi:hypothetical protein
MALTQDVATEQYQLACDQLMEIAEDYSVAETTAEIALAATQKLTIQFIDHKIKEINALARQYEAFIKTMETTIENLEQTPIEQLLMTPLKEGVQTAKKKSLNPPVTTSWAIRLAQFLRWVRTR